jgi:hypothetical protein
VSTLLLTISVEYVVGIAVGKGPGTVSFT